MHQRYTECGWIHVQLMLTQVCIEAALDEGLGFVKAAAVEQVQHHAIASSKLRLQPLRAFPDDVPGRLPLLIPVLHNHTVSCTTLYRSVSKACQSPEAAGRLCLARSLIFVERSSPCRYAWCHIVAEAQVSFCLSVPSGYLTKATLPPELATV